MVELIDCAGCGLPVAVRSSRCWRCGHAVADSLARPRSRPDDGSPAAASSAAALSVRRRSTSGLDSGLAHGLSTAAVLVVVLSVASLVSLAGVTLLARERAMEAAVAASPAPPVNLVDASPTPGPAPTAEPLSSAEPGTWVVGDGESLFSVATATGIDPNLLVHWNAETYPSLRSSPALRRGWVLQLSGPMPATPTPRPTRAPAGTPEPIQVGNLPAIPTIDGSYFSAPARVVTYEITGSGIGQLLTQLERAGPPAPWGEGNAVAVTQTTIYYNFGYRTAADGSCEVRIGSSGQPITFAFTVTLPRWVPTETTAPATVEWWIGQLLEIVEHENTHVEIYLSYLEPLNDAVRTGTCESVPIELDRLLAEANRENCEFDYEEYGRELGLRLQDCLAGG